MKSFRIKNIKSFVDSGDIEIAPITIFVGKNSCGKSSLIRFPAVVAQTFLADTDSPIKFYGKMLDYGNYEDVIHGHKNGDISFEIKNSFDAYQLKLMNLSEKRYINNAEKRAERVDVAVEVTIGKSKRTLAVKKLVFSINGDIAYKLTRVNENIYQYQLYCLLVDGNLQRLNKEYCFPARLANMDGLIPNIFVSMIDIAKALNFGIENAKNANEMISRMLDYSRYLRYQDNAMLDINEQLNKQLSIIEKKCALVSNTIDYLRMISGEMSKTMEREARTLSYIGPFRDNPERVYRDPEKRSTAVGTKGENVSTLLINDYHNQEGLIYRISKWLNDAMGYKISVKDLRSNLFQIMIEDEYGFQSNILDVGYGISQILPIVAEIFRKSTIEELNMRENYVNKMLIVEQPELHLHPAAQAELASLFVEFALQKGNQLLIETHSEHLIRKLQVYIANPNSKLTKDMVKIYYVDKKDGLGEARIDEMIIGDDGRFETEWPSGFFDKAFDLTMELAEF